MGVPVTSNNFERMKIVLDMVDPFDYDEFIHICEGEKVMPLSLNEYAMKVGYLQIAMVKYPEYPIEEAYLKVIEDTNNQTLPQQGCPSCGNKQDKSLPSLSQQAGSLISGVAIHAMNGFKNVDEKALENRTVICNNCEDMRSDGRCSKCGCFMTIKAKWEAASCPAKKW